jgi:hypothetical protein
MVASGWLSSLPSLLMMHGQTNIEIVNVIKSSVLRRAGHVVRMDENELLLHLVGFLLYHRY